LIRQIVNGHWFALLDVVLVLASGAVWMLSPEVGPWIILIALLPWGLRLIAGKFPFQRTRFDWLLLVFLMTAWVAFWAAYDRISAWNKVWLIVMAVLLYYALASQPKQNFAWISFILFGIGVGVSVYFFLTHDFTGDPAGLAARWMNIRPGFGWRAVHHGYISGVVVITTFYSLYGIWELRKIFSRGLLIFLSLLILPGLGIIIGAFILTLSRGIWLAIAGVVGAWVLWKVLSPLKPGVVPLKWVFPVAVLMCLCGLVAFAFIGPARLGESVTQSEYGGNTRSELFLRGAYFLEEYPILGGGLNAFPGLYSHYLLVIPRFYFVNSYNLFLDVGIEQGLIGGLAFLLVYIGSVWFGSQAVIKAQSPGMRLLNWLSLSALIVAMVHGMLYDYLYNGAGAFLLFLPAGVSMNSMLHSPGEDEERPAEPSATSKERNIRIRFLILATAGLLILILVLNVRKVQSIWYANLGAVQMAQVELMGFPTGQWTDPNIVPSLEAAEDSLLTSLQFDPANRTANHRLGLISMLQADFESASRHLETAHKKAPGHRGIIKSLGYCYVWLGDLDRAQSLLSEIPEANDELGVYAWWWNIQGRDDLSEKASLVISRLRSSDIQP
jgi:tetratricopeptide (TPR) repeat protein